MDKLDFLEINNYSGESEPEWLLFFLHGLGASGHDFTDFPKALRFHNKRVKFVFPHAPVIPVTLNGGLEMPAWYDILSMDFEREFDRVSVDVSLKLLVALFEKILNKYPLKTVFLGGFSQGGAMSMELARTLLEKNTDIKLNGLMILSSYFLYPEQVCNSKLAALKKLPILMAHGLQDPIVPHELGHKHAHLLNDFDLTWKEYAMEHIISQQELSDLNRWMVEQSCR